MTSQDPSPETAELDTDDPQDDTPDVDPDSVSDPAMDDGETSEWAAEGGATPVGPSTDTDAS